MKKLLLILATLLLTIQFSTAQSAASEQVKAKYDQLILVKNYDGALALLEESHAKNPDDVSNTALLACMYLYKNMHDKAAPLIETSLKVISEDPKNHMLNLYIFGREDEAWKLAEKNDKTEDLKQALAFMVGPDATPAKFRLVLLGIETSEFEKQMKQQMTK